jgi:hypothetical protein
MLTKTKLVLAAALILGTASGAMASRGAVMPGSLDGVNPAYHPGIFGNAATAASYGFVKTPQGWAVSTDRIAHGQTNQR